MSNLLLDTTVLIDLSHGDEQTARFLNEELAVNEPAVSAVSVMELLVGVKNKQEMKAVSELITYFRPIPVTEPITETSIGLIKTFILSHRMSIPDALIAATALVHNLTLITSNVKHFQMIPNLVVKTPL